MDDSMGDHFAYIGWMGMCEYGDEGHDRSYHRREYFPRRRFISKEEWIDRQRGRPQDVFNDGFTDGT